LPLSLASHDEYTLDVVVGEQNRRGKGGAHQWTVAKLSPWVYGQNEAHKPNEKCEDEQDCHFGCVVHDAPFKSDSWYSVLEGADDYFLTVSAHGEVDVVSFWVVVQLGRVYLVKLPGSLGRHQLVTPPTRPLTTVAFPSEFSHDASMIVLFL
jgi:hypothetical protein